MKNKVINAAQRLVKLNKKCNTILGRIDCVL